MNDLERTECPICGAPTMEVSDGIACTSCEWWAIEGFESECPEWDMYLESCREVVEHLSNIVQGQDHPNLVEYAVIMAFLQFSIKHLDYFRDWLLTADLWVIGSMELVRKATQKK